jgi:hypothetical protein
VLLRFDALRPGSFFAQMQELTDAKAELGKLPVSRNRNLSAARSRVNELVAGDHERHLTLVSYHDVKELCLRRSKRMIPPLRKRIERMIGLCAQNHFSISALTCFGSRGLGIRTHSVVIPNSEASYVPNSPLLSNLKNPPNHVHALSGGLMLRGFPPLHGRASALEPIHLEISRPVLSQPADPSSAMARGKRMLFSRWMC